MDWSQHKPGTSPHQQLLMSTTAGWDKYITTSHEDICVCGVHVHSSTCTSPLLLPAPYCLPPTACPLLPAPYCLPPTACPLNPKSMPSTCTHINQYAIQPTTENITKHYNVYVDTHIHRNTPTLYIQLTSPVSCTGAGQNSSHGSLGCMEAMSKCYYCKHHFRSSLYISQHNNVVRLCEVTYTCIPSY